MLNKFLHRINVVEDPTYKCGEGIETVRYFLLTCTQYEREREILRKAVGVQGMRVEKILGDIKTIMDTIKYIEDIGRFKFQKEENCETRNRQSQGLETKNTIIWRSNNSQDR